MRVLPFYLILFLLFSLHSLAQESTVIVNGRLHIGDGSVIEEGAIGFREGIIDFVGRAKSVDQKMYKTVIDASGKDIYPGIIACNTSLGLNEISAVRATRDYYETGSFNPSVRSIIAYNAESDVVASVLSNGILLAQVCPQGGRISGTSSIVKLKGWNWEDAAYSIDDGIHINWPSMYKRKEDNTANEREKNPNYDKEHSELMEFFQKAKAYSSLKYPVETDLKMEALRGVFSGEKNVYIHADFVKELREAIYFKRELGLPNVTLVGAYDSHLLTDLIKENDISVMITRVNSLPSYYGDPIDLPYSLPKKLEDAGVLYSLQMEGGMETMQNRNLIFNAGTAVAYGLDKEAALKSITLNAATILGIEERTGSLTKGKDANIIISEGDLLDMRFSQVTKAFILGEEILLTNRQTELYEKYKRKYEEEKEGF